MTERPALHRYDVVLFVVGAVVLVVISSVISWRVGYAPDETSHLTVVDVLADHGRPLTWEDTRYGADRGHAYHLYSPVSYLPYVPARWLADAIGPMDGATHPNHVIVRFGAWPIAVAQLAVTWNLIRRVLRGSPASLALAVAFAANLLPQLRYMHAYVTTDGMTVLAGTVAVAVAARVLQRPKIEPVDGVLSGLAIALCGHVRYNALIVASVVVLALVWRVVRSDQRWRPRLRPLAVALAIALVLAAPFHIWVYQEQANRHWTASASHESLRESTFLGGFTDDVSTAELVRIRRSEVDAIGQGFWLGFQKYHLISYRDSRNLTMAIVVGLGAVFASRRITRSIKVLTLVLVAAFFATWVAMAAQWPFTGHGRFLLPVGLSLVAISVSGPTAMLERSKVPAVLVPAAMALAFGWHLLGGISALGS